MMAAMVSRFSRTVFEECFKWAHQRQVSLPTHTSYPTRLLTLHPSR